MAGGIDWFRWHHGSVTDPKFQLVARKADARLGDVITVWAFVLEKASADAERGTIGELDLETIDFLLGAEDGTAARILDAMTDRGLIVGSRIAKWEERQPKREREDDTAAERKRQQRAREANQNHVTPCHTTSHQKTPREEKSREDKEHMSGKPDVLEVLAYLNQKAKRNYRAVDSNLKVIAARLGEGATVADCKAVIDAKVKDWLGDPKMDEYLRPETLFNATKFAGYVGKLGAAQVQHIDDWRNDPRFKGCK